MRILPCYNIELKKYFKEFFTSVGAIQFYSKFSYLDHRPCRNFFFQRIPICNPIKVQIRIEFEINFPSDFLNFTPSYLHL